MKNFLLSFVFIILFTGCGKEEEGCTPVSPQAEELKITTYTNANGITAVKHSSGMYYQIIDPGTGVTPTIKSTVKATYTGIFLDGTVFDSETVDISLSEMIEGWQIGIPLIKKGGRIKLIIPSALAYGCNGNIHKEIGPDEVLFYDVNLLDVQ